MQKLILLIFSLLLTTFLSAQSWNQIGNDIDGEASGDQSGYALSINNSGNIVAVGAYANDGNGQDAGHVRIYSFNGSSWNQLGNDIEGEATEDQSGESVSINGDGTIVAIGATGNDGNGTYSGHVRIYNYDGSTWNQLGNDIDGEYSGDKSGRSVSLSNDGYTLAIGAGSNSENGSNSGHVRIYNYDGSSWSQLGDDIDGEATNDYSGCSVSISSDGSIVAVGAYANDGNGQDAGHVRIYSFNGSSWSQLGDDIDGEAANDYSGWSVSLDSDGNTIAIGSPDNNANGSNSGHVRIYNYNGSNWNKIGGNIDGESAEDQSGNSVSISSDGNTVSIGAHEDDANGSNSGHVRIYNYNGASWNKIGNDIDGEAANDYSGKNISLSSNGSCLAIGAFENDGNNNTFESGHVRIYTLSGCTDSTATNYNSLVAIDDGSCSYLTISQNDTSICYPSSICLEASIGQNISNNNSLSFNGANNYIDGGDINSLEPNYISVGAWFKSTSTGGTQYIIGKSGSNPGYVLGICCNNNLFFGIGCDGNGSVQGNVQAINDNCNQSYADGKWHFVVGTYDGVNIKIYVDGEFKNQHTLNGGPIWSANFPLDIGFRPGNTSYFNGLISDVSISDYAFSSAEVENYYCSGLTGNENGLLAYWKMDEGSGSILYDASPNNINLNINSAAWNVESKPNCTFYNYNWSTNDTTSSITINPNQTSSFWVTQTQNGISYSDSITITVTQGDTSFANITTCDSSILWNGITYNSSGVYSYNGKNNNSALDISFNEWVTIPTWTPTLSYTLSAWVEFPLLINTSSPSTWNTIFSKDLGNYHHIIFGDNGELGVYSSGFIGSGFYASSLSAGYHNITAVAHNTITKFYIDGDYVGQSNILLAAPIDILGNFNGDGTQPAGNIDDITIWGKNLSQQEIQSYMNCPPTGNESGLVGYWNFEDSSNSNIALDISINGNHGSINGASYDTIVPSQSCNLTNANGCDSTAIINLTIHSPIITTSSLSICGGSSIMVGSSIYDSTGNYTDTLISINGCDSIINTTLNIININISQNNTTICSGDSITLNIDGILNDGLVAYYPFNGNANDESGNENNGTVNGATLVADRFGNTNSAYYFDGINDFIQIAHSNTLAFNDNNLSVSFWLEIPNYSLGSGNYIERTPISKEPWHFETTDGYGSIGTPQFDVSGSQCNYESTTLSVPLNQWANIVATYNGDTIQLYMNGALLGEEFCTSTTFNTSDLFFGQHSFFHQRFFLGKLDDIRIYNKQLSTAEIENLYTETNEDIGYYWSTEDSTISITVSPSQTTTYYLVDSIGCTDSVTINVLPVTSDTSITACDSVVWNGTTYTQSGTYSYSGSSVINNYSLSFNGNGDNVVVNNSNPLNPNQELSISCWVNLDQHSCCNQYVAKWDYYNGLTQYILGSNSQGIYFWLNDEFFQTQTLPLLSTWENISLVYSSINNLGYIYLNSQVVYSFSLINTNLASTVNPVYIGGNPSGVVTNSVDGKIDNITIWDTELSQSEIQEYMNCPPTGTETGLVGYWNFEEGNGTTVFDQTSNGNDGTINGATYNTNVPSQSCALTNSNGCDSTAILNLTINNSTSSYLSVSECDSYLWAANGIIYTNSGIYTDTSTNINGCLHTDSLNLTINYSTTSTSTITECDTYNWNGTNYTTSGVYTFASTNSNGCADTATLNLTINLSTTSSNISGSLQVLQGTTESYVPSPANIASTYIWGSSLNSLVYTSPSGDSISINFLVPGNELIYFIETTSNGCIGDTIWMEIKVESHSSINQIQIDGLNIYPNPSKDLFNIEFSSLLTQDLLVTIINSVGEVIFKDYLENYIGEYKKQINLKEYSKAIYFLKIKTSNGIINKKLILQ